MNAKSGARRRYSILAMVLMIAVPVLMYVAAASESVAMREAIQQGNAPNVADLATGGSLFMMRLGSILLGVIGLFLALFGSPKETAPKWMISK